ncbi:MAG TPA: CrcB family protein [Acidimicrobiia bacterium]|nr:CrcB family protein [Acidimicrobiia bacterium]
MVASRRLSAWVAVATGGAIGTVARYEATLRFPVRAGEFPWTILVVNLVGCVAAGVLMAIVHHWATCPSWVRPFAVIGVCGGLTTFSTWMVTDVLLARDSAGALAVLDVVVSLVAGVVAVWIGFDATRRIVGDRGSIGALDPTEAD